MLSKVTYLLCAVFIVMVSFMLHPRWKQVQAEATIGWDVTGYYWYLPSAIIYKDLKQQKFADRIFEKYQPAPSFEQSFVHESGNRVMVYSSGMAFMYLPFFTVAHLAAKPLGYPADGFSVPYQLALQIGSLIVALLGLWYFRKLLLRFYNDKVCAAMLFILVFGTNYLNYTAVDGALTHNWLFTVYVFILLNTIYFHETFKPSYAIRIGLLCGLAILTRPSEIIAILIPLLWGMESISPTAIKERLALYKARYKPMLLAAACTVAVAGIQVVYWLYVAGQPLVYSYTDKGFSWLRPHTFNYIFSYRSGWLTYTPMVILVIIGIIPFLLKGSNKVAVLAFFALNLYIVSAWDVWWYGGTGGRAMIQSYPVILLPLATLLTEVFRRRRLIYIIAPAILLFTYFNLWFTYQAHAANGLYDTESMSRSYYWAVAGRWSVPNEIKKLKTTDELFTGIPRNMQLLYANNFERDTSIGQMPLPAIEGEKSAFVASGITYSTIAGFPYQRGKAEWLRAQATFNCADKEWTTWKTGQFTVWYTKAGNVVKARAIRIPYFLQENEKKDLYIDTRIPREDFDSVKVLLWNPGSDMPLLFDNLQVYSFNE